MPLDADWATPMLFALIALVVVGFVLIFIGATIVNDARVGLDNDYNRSRKRTGRRIAITGDVIALFSGVGAVVVALLMGVPL